MVHARGVLRFHAGAPHLLLYVAVALLVASVLSAPRLARSEPRPRHGWHTESDAEQTLEMRVPPPADFTRLPVSSGSFGEWLRGLPLKPGRPPVHLFDGRVKFNQRAHLAVFDIDTGTRDLQQCADAVMRLRAEYLFAKGKDDRACFHFTSGSLSRWTDWREGLRPQVRGRTVSWSRSAAPAASYAAFRAWLETVFLYSGSASLARELARGSMADLQPGDVFIEGGYPGHAVLVVDVAVSSIGRRAFLLAQSYMPAQEIHLLDNPGDTGTPWYEVEEGAPLVTPEWKFKAARPMRFRDQACPARR